MRCESPDGKCASQSGECLTRESIPNDPIHRTTGRRSNESIELQPLHLGAAFGKNPKGVLRRMPRVRSDEMHAEAENGAGSAAAGVDHHDTVAKEKTPSPIGAGLPLLQRLRLLKEKQVSSSAVLPFQFQSNRRNTFHPHFSLLYSL